MSVLISAAQPISIIRHGTSDYDPPVSSTPAEPQYEVPQLKAFTEHSSSGKGHETPAKQQDGSASSRSVTPKLSQDHVANALSDYPSFNIEPETPHHQLVTVVCASSLSTESPHEDPQLNAFTRHPRPSIRRDCPICGKEFRRVQERDRHLVLYLPHSIYCPHQGCHWKGRRQCDFRRHWEMKHRKTDQVPGKEKIEIYDPKEFVRLIVHGTSPVEVARSAFVKVQERLKELGKVDVEANMWHRKRKLDIEISMREGRP